MGRIRLGSLFDGSGGFPLAGVICGMEPIWASEIEPYPMRVTAARFPEMKQLGDVTKIDGGKVEPVDVITFGSPCQDLSVAGKQAGIHQGERSNLFFEAIRIIREMRGVSADQHPRFAVWENVPGAFSSNKGADFAAVLEALCRVKEPDVSVPQPEGGWKPAGLIVGDGYSIAWRVYDAQYWGVPQRRKRIYLVADFGSERAGEILFESEGMHGDSQEGGEKRKETSANAGGSTERSCNAWSLKGNFIDRETKQNGIGWRADICYTLDATDRHGVVYPEKVRTLTARMDSSPCVDRGQNVVVTTYAPEGNHCGAYREDDTSATLQTKYHYGGGGDDALVIENHPQDSRVDFAKNNIAPTLNAKMGTGGVTCR